MGVNTERLAAARKVFVDRFNRENEVAGWSEYLRMVDGRVFEVREVYSNRYSYRGFCPTHQVWKEVPFLSTYLLRLYKEADNWDDYFWPEDDEE
jgi:hypothetical protein